MTSFVADLLVNPVIRQARRFSFSSLTSSVNTTAPGSPLRTAQARRYNHPEDIISETEENFYLGDDAEGSASSSPSSRSSVQPHPATDVADLREGHSQSDSALIPAAHNPFELPLRSVDSRRVGTQNEPMPPNDSNMDATDRPTDVDPSLRSDTYGRLVLPEDDGMGTLRKRILVVQAQDIDASEKARLMHQLLIEGYKRSQVTVQRERPFTPSSSGTSEQRSPQVQRPLDSFKFWQNSLAEAELAEAFNLTDADLEPTFAPKVSSTASTGDLEDPEYPDYRPLGCLATETMEGDIGERNAQVSGLTTLGNPDVAAVRDVRRRRHSSNVMNSSAIEPNLDSRIPERYRLARSVSPLPIPGPSLNGSVVGASGMENWEDEENQDILSLWSRVPRSIGSGEDEEDESDDNESSDEEVEEEEADESDDDDDFGLLGHR
ncbi:Uu.00g074360.m01.CDS01 [Anthostomella pinea]|uniref:Uu.00g074360.m01.CDS01 n=1 Tax=Anthostomella pinea TaxID=933095 RepID=A0AAI8YP57_9PEZI|nr:Uu.00g074360.m01.CDS01 [Anthostomella pinea]